MDIIIDKFKSNLTKLLLDKKSIVIALSGGIDSIALACILLNLKNELNLKLIACYINHNLRGIESIAEEFFVSNFCKKNNLPLYKLKIKKTTWDELEKESFEMAARRIRYDFFNKILNEKKFDYIATAHNFNDKIETFLMQLFRAGSISTLRSIPSKKNNIIRPLLKITRKEIENYISENSIQYIKDSTNDKNIFKRNIVRNKLIKIFKEIHPDYEKSFIHIFQFFQEEYSLINYLTFSNYKKILIYDSDNKICISKEKYLKLPVAIQKNILKFIIKRLHFPTKITLNLLNSLSGKKEKYQFKQKNFFCKDGGKFILFIDLNKLNILEKNISIYELPFIFDSNKLILNLDKKINVDPKKEFCFLFDETFFPLNIRQLKINDSIYISDNDKKLVKNILKDIKIPEPLHKEVIILETNDEKIIGFMLNQFYRVSKEFYIKNKNEENVCLTVEYL